jgi:nucleoside-diphosphate-sugar epimerase
MSEIVTLEAQQDDPRKRKPDINKAKKYLNWEPKVSISLVLQYWLPNDEQAQQLYYEDN